MGEEAKKKTGKWKIGAAVVFGVVVLGGAGAGAAVALSGGEDEASTSGSAVNLNGENSLSEFIAVCDSLVGSNGPLGISTCYGGVAVICQIGSSDILVNECDCACGTGTVNIVNNFNQLPCNINNAEAVCLGSADLDLDALKNSNIESITLDEAVFETLAEKCINSDIAVDVDGQFSSCLSTDFDFNCRSDFTTMTIGRCPGSCVAEVGETEDAAESCTLE